ncbi:metal-sulfur cluster assembly factor [Streptomyces sp. NPDC098781]|uniref:metal-sulfur cluster assembly factor n=1 Tax=Streptomyces sp. NPDC098781 TaxID=3366097 RepID=UPI0037FA0E99
MTEKSVATAVAATHTDEQTHTGEHLLREINRRINSVGDPCSVAHGSPLGLVDMGMVESVVVGGDGHLRVGMRLTSPSCYMVGYFAEEIRERLADLPRITQVTVEFDNGLDWTPQLMTESGRHKRRQALAARGIEERVGVGLPLMPVAREAGA